MGVGLVINACCNLIDHIIQSEEIATSVKRPFTVKVCKYVHLFVCLFSKMCSFHVLCVFVIFSRKTGY